MINPSISWRIRMNSGHCGICCLELSGLRPERKKQWDSLNDSVGPFTFEAPSNVNFSYIPMMRREIPGKSMPRKRKGEKNVCYHLKPLVTDVQGRSNSKCCESHNNHMNEGSCSLRIIPFIHLLTHLFIQQILIRFLFCPGYNATQWW